MPDFQHGRLTRIFLNGVDLSRVLTSMSVTSGYDTTETTTFGQGYQSFVTGLRQGGEASFDGRVEASNSTILRRAVRDAEGRDDSILTVSNGNDTLGTTAECIRGLLGTKEFSSSADDVVQFTLGFAGNRGVDDALTLNSSQSILTATGFGTGYNDDVASPANTQAIGYLHVLELTGGTAPTVVVKIQDSPDNSTWTDLVTFATFGPTGVRTAQRIVVNDPPAQYFRAGWTITGTPTAVRFNVAVARGRTGEDVS